MRIIRKLCVVVLLLISFFIVQENNIGTAQVGNCPQQESCYTTAYNAFNTCLTDAHSDLSECQTDATNYYNSCASDALSDRTYCENVSDANYGTGWDYCYDTYIRNIPTPDYSSHSLCMGVVEDNLLDEYDACESQYDITLDYCQEYKQDILAICNQVHGAMTQQCSQSKEQNDATCAAIECP